jgi:hypothetical protein
VKVDTHVNPFCGSLAHVHDFLVAVYSSPSITNVISSIGSFASAPERPSYLALIVKFHLSIASATSISQSNTTTSSLA